MYPHTGISINGSGLNINVGISDSARTLYGARAWAVVVFTPAGFGFKLCVILLGLRGRNYGYLDIAWLRGCIQVQWYVNVVRVHLIAA